MCHKLKNYAICAACDREINFPDLGSIFDEECDSVKAGTYKFGQCPDCQVVTSVNGVRHVRYVVPFRWKVYVSPRPLYCSACREKREAARVDEKE